MNYMNNEIWICCKVHSRLCKKYNGLHSNLDKCFVTLILLSETSKWMFLFLKLSK